MKKRAELDFETEAIGPRPKSYPPKPVGVAIRVGGRAEYLAWGHRGGGNNTTFAKAKARVKEIWRDYRVIMHNAAFDIEVAMEHMGLGMPEEFEDTLILSFLDDPRAISLSLKPLTEMKLGMPPVERDKLKDWILENVPGAKESDWGGYIADAPATIAGPYAKSDVVRTGKLFDHMHQRVSAAGMLDWYAKEKALIAVKLKMEQGGIRVNQRKLNRDIPKWQAMYDDLEVTIRKRLGITKEWEAENCTEGVFNPSSGPQLAKALSHSGQVTNFIMTAKGNVSVKRENLAAVCDDKKLLQALSFHGVVETYLSTFLKRWQATAAEADGYVHPTFNTVRSTDEYGSKGGVGTRTGRFSSSNPNFQNIPASVEESKNAAILIPLAKLARSYDLEFIGLRDYLIPDEGCVFIGRDYSQQELRIFAHYEDGLLLQMYHEDPKMDIHEAIRQIVHQVTGLDYPRKAIKITVFSILYGAGVDKLARELGTDRDGASTIRNAIYKAIPGIRALNKALARMARKNEPMFTWGGRAYYCEPPRRVKGQMRSFEYKMLNLLIQGSAADCTKVAMLNMNQSLKHSRIVLQVHDELLACAPRAHWKAEMERMRVAMEDVKFDLPMLTDGKSSSVSWARMK